MLVLSRKKNESIIINDNITVTVIEIRGDKVRLGIEAPKDVTVHRREVYEAIQNQTKAREHGPTAVTPEADLSSATWLPSFLIERPARLNSSPTSVGPGPIAPSRA